jgi:hypothetical protein
MLSSRCLLPGNFLMANGKNKLPVYSWKTHGELSWAAYKNGYLKAVNILIQNVIDDEGTYLEKIPNNFGLVYPIIFLCRHYIEIELKQVIALASMMQFAAANKRRGHKLNLLWSDVLQCVESVQGKERRTEFEEAFAALFEFFEHVDPNGDGFRYPKNIQGKAQWDDPFDVDIPKIKSEICLLEAYLYELLEELKQMLEPEARDMSDRIYFY